MHSNIFAVFAGKSLKVEQMSKRFINTDIWDKAEFLDSDQNHKLLFFYIVTRCDNIGIFEISLRMASFQLGFEVTEDFLLKSPINIEKISGGKFWLPKFCFYQYGELKETCKPHTRYIQDLKNNNLYERVLKGYTKGIQTLEEKEEDKDKDQDKEKDKEILEKFEIWWNAYDYKKGREKTFDKWKRIKSQDREKCLEVVYNYVKSTPDKNYRKYPTTYLNQSAWNDEIVSPVKKKEGLSVQEIMDMRKELFGEQNDTKQIPDSI